MLIMQQHWHRSDGRGQERDKNTKLEGAKGDSDMDSGVTTDVREIVLVSEAEFASGRRT